MSKKELFDYLEKSDEGKSLIGKVRKIFDDYDSEAASRRTRADTLEAAFRAVGISDVADPTKAADELRAKIEAAGKPGAESAQLIDTLTKKLTMIEVELKTEREGREKATKDKQRSDIQTAFEADLRKHFGDTVGTLLTRQYLDDGSFIFDEKGLPVMKTTDAVYTKDQAVEHLKAKHKDALKPAPTEGGGGQPRGGDRSGGQQLPVGDQSTVSLISAGLGLKA